MGMEVYSAETAFVLEYLAERVKGTTVRAVSGSRGLDDETGTDEVEW